MLQMHQTNPCDDDDAIGTSARRHHSSSDSSDDLVSATSSGIFHRALSRRRTLAEIEEPILFDLPPLLLDDDVYDDDNEETFRFTRNNAISPDQIKATLTARRLQHDYSRSRSLSITEIKSARKVPLTKSQSAQFQNEIVRERLSKLQNSVRNRKKVEVIAVEEQIVSLDANGVSKPCVRCSTFSQELCDITHDVTHDLNDTTLSENEAGEPKVKITIHPTHDKQNKESISDWPPEHPEPVAVQAEKRIPPPQKSPRAKVALIKPAVPASETYSDISLVSGFPVSVGKSEPMTLSQNSDEVEGVEAAFGSSRPMSSDDDRDLHEQSMSLRTEMLTDDLKKKKRSIRDVFRLGLAWTKKNKRKSSLTPATGAVESEVASTPPPQHRLYQRRISRLDNNEPIEDVFSGIEFATIEKNSISDNESCADSDVIEDNDIIEDPDVVIMASIREKQRVVEQKKENDSIQPSKKDSNIIAFDDLTNNSKVQSGANTENCDWDDLT